MSTLTSLIKSLKIEYKISRLLLSYQMQESKTMSLYQFCLFVVVTILWLRLFIMLSTLPQ